MVRIAAIDAVVTFTRVFPKTMVTNSCLGLSIKEAARRSDDLSDVRSFSIVDLDKEKYAVSDPEKKAEKAKSKRKVRLK